MTFKKTNEPKPASPRWKKFVNVTCCWGFISGDARRFISEERIERMTAG
ncbi:hypothetical protein [Bacillus xiapuensis]|nr:hypothetical protein [Bacillus xiapuensis]